MKYLLSLLIIVTVALSAQAQNWYKHTVVDHQYHNFTSLEQATSYWEGTTENTIWCSRQDELIAVYTHRAIAGFRSETKLGEMFSLADYGNIRQYFNYKEVYIYDVIDVLVVTFDYSDGQSVRVHFPMKGATDYQVLVNEYMIYKRVVGDVGLHEIVNKSKILRDKL